MINGEDVVTTALDHVAELERAWADPRNIAIDLPPVDVNAVLRAHYRVDPDLTYTTDMLWDMETRKATAPDVFIPSMIRPHSATVWPVAPHEPFPRGSHPRLGLHRE